MRKLKKLILTLVALLAVTTGAWAQGKLIYEKDFSSDTEYPFYLDAADKTGASATVTDGLLVLTNPKVQENNWDVQPEIGRLTSAAPITQGNTYRVVMQYKTTVAGSVTFALGAQDWSNPDWSGQTITVSNDFQTCEAYFNNYPYSNSESHILLQFGELVGTITIKKVEVYELYPVPLTWDTTTKTATIASMPAGNVFVVPEYYPQAALATNGVTAPTTYVWAKTEDPLAVVADGAVTGGTLMFAFGTETTYPDLDGDDWQTAIPTAENLDGAGGTTYVWFYIKGDDEHSDSEPQRLTIHVQPEHEYTVSMAEGTDDAANWKAGKNDATPTTLPLEGVKKGDKVTVKYDGERKVIGVKAEKVVKIKTFSIQGPTGNVSPGQTITFTIINIQPAEATNQTFEWKLVSGTPEGTTIESISDDTKTVTVKAGSSMGPITIRATAKDGSGYSNTKMVWLIP